MVLRARAAGPGRSPVQARRLVTWHVVGPGGCQRHIELAVEPQTRTVTVTVTGKAALHWHTDSRRAGLSVAAQPSR
jgi:hypothetical protein